MNITYSEKFYDDFYEYRLVFVEEFKIKKLYSESEWRGIGIQMGRGWEHFSIQPNHPDTFIFRRMTDEGFEKIRNEPQSIIGIDNPSEQLQLEAVKQDWRALACIEKPTSVMIEHAKKQKPDVLKLLERARAR